jgi:hypothetical protein
VDSPLCPSTPTQPDKELTCSLAAPSTHCAQSWQCCCAGHGQWPVISVAGWDPAVLSGEDEGNTEKSWCRRITLLGAPHHTAQGTPPHCSGRCSGHPITLLRALLRAPHRTARGTPSHCSGHPIALLGAPHRTTWGTPSTLAQPQLLCQKGSVMPLFSCWVGGVREVHRTIGHLEGTGRITSSPVICMCHS